MRIGLITDTFLPLVDGVGRVVIAYADQLCTMGHQVTVSAPLYDTGHRGGYPFELVDYAAFRVPKTPQYKTGSPTLDGHYRRRMEMIPLDIVHAHSPLVAGQEALRLKKQRGIPLIGTFHSKYYDDFLKVTKSETIAKSLLKPIIRFYKQCDEVWAVSQSSAKVLASYGFSGPIHVMTNGTQLRSFDPSAGRQVREQYGLGEVPTLLFVGQIDWKKNIQRVLEAASIVLKAGKPFKLVLAGQGPDAEAIRQKADSLGLSGHLIMTGMIREPKILDALYEAADLFVFPSLYDTFSMVIREAAAMGTPSVAVKGSCAAEAIKDRINGYLCEDEANSLAQVILEAFADKEANSQIGQAAKESIPVVWEQVMEDVVQRYQNLVDHNTISPSPSYLRYQRRNPKAE